jgi:hypothetical protein
MPTSKHNLRFDDELWGAMEDRAKEIADLGIVSDRYPQFRFSVTDIVHRETEVIRNETLEQTLARYGLTDPRVVTR